MDPKADRKSAWLSALLLALTLLAGAGLRFYPLYATGFSAPYDLGGLFYQMSAEILGAGFSLPQFIPHYSAGGLPFAYPPLSFYLQALFLKFITPRLFVSVNLLPPLLSLVSLLCFIPLAKRVIPGRWGALAAVFVFAVLPQAYVEQVQAMGLAESLGTVCLVLYPLSLLWAKDRPVTAWLAPGLLLALCAVSSPGSAYAGLALSLLFAAWALVASIRARDARPLAGCMVVAAAGILLSMPWWLRVVHVHGLEVFLGAFSSQNASFFTELAERALGLKLLKASPFWNVLFILSFTALLFKKRFWLAAGALLLLLLPREHWVAAVPVSLVIGAGAAHLVELLSHLSKRKPNLVRVALAWSLALIALADSAFTQLATLNAETYDLTPVQVEDLGRIAQSGGLPVGAPLLVIGSDGLIEWTPALVQHVVLNNSYGLEWVPARYETVRSFSAELQAAPDLRSVLALAAGASAPPGPVYLITSPEQLQRLVGASQNSSVAPEPLFQGEEILLVRLDPAQ